jgi:hypothetical protein
MHRFYNEDDSSEHRAGQLLNMFVEQADSVPRTKFQFALESEGELVGTCGIRLESSGEGSIGCEIGRQLSYATASERPSRPSALEIECSKAGRGTRPFCR